MLDKHNSFKFIQNSIEYHTNTASYKSLNSSVYGSNSYRATTPQRRPTTTTTTEKKQRTRDNFLIPFWILQFKGNIISYKETDEDEDILANVEKWNKLVL